MLIYVHGTVEREIRIDMLTLIRADSFDLIALAA